VVVTFFLRCRNVSASNRGAMGQKKKSHPGGSLAALVCALLALAGAPTPARAQSKEFIPKEPAPKADVTPSNAAGTADNGLLAPNSDPIYEGRATPQPWPCHCGATNESLVTTLNNMPHGRRTAVFQVLHAWLWPGTIR
jgi:hypothetical protein